MFLFLIKIITIVYMLTGFIMFFGAKRLFKKFSDRLIVSIIIAMTNVFISYYYLIRNDNLATCIIIHAIFFLNIIITGTYKLLKDGEYFNDFKEFLDFKIWTTKIKENKNSKS